MRPLISIIIPAYNSASYLPDTIISIQNQSYTHWECLIIDDGSTDNTKEIITCFLSADKRINYYYQENQGLSAARNYGITKAEGVFIQLLDSDDILFPEKLLKMILQYEVHNNQNVILFSDFEFTLHSDPYIKDHSIRKLYKDITQLGSIDFRKLYWGWDLNFVIPTHAFLFPSSILKNTKYNISLKSKEDWDLYLSILRDGTLLFHPVDYLGCGYRLRENSMSQNYTKMLQYTIVVLHKWKPHYFMYIIKLSFYFIQLYIKKIKGIDINYREVINTYKSISKTPYIDLLLLHCTLPFTFIFKTAKIITGK